MARSKLSSLEQFVFLFNNLKESAKNDPKKLEVFYEQNSVLKKSADALFRYIGFGDFERRVFHGGKKYIPQAPDGFDKTWKEYKNSWAGPLMDCIFKIDLGGIFPELEGLPERGSSKPEVEMELEAPDPDFDTEFDPLHHDGGKALDNRFVRR